MRNDVHMVSCETVPFYSSPREPFDKDVGGIIRRISHINYTNLPIVVTERSGLKYVIPYVSNSYQRVFIIREEFMISPNHAVALAHFFTTAEIEEIDRDGLGVIKDLFWKAYDKNKSTHIHITINTVVKQEDIEAKKHVYVNNKDIVLSCTEIEKTPKHPFSNSTLLCERYRNITQNMQGLSFFIELIDNEQTISARYFYLAKRVFKIHPVVDESRVSGVYFGTINNQPGESKTFEPEYFSLNEAETKLGLYRTREEALSAGDVKSLRQEEIVNLAHANAVSALELQRAQQEHKTEVERLKVQSAERDLENKILTLSFENRVKELERENKLLEAQFAKEKVVVDRERMIRDDYYAERSQDRKDQSEMWKFAPVVLTALLAVFTIYQKVKKTTEGFFGGFFKGVFGR